MAAWNLVARFPSDRIEGDSLLEALDARLEDAAGVCRYLGPGGEAAIEVPLAALLPEEPEGTDRVLFVASDCPDDSLQELLLGLECGDLAGGEPHWALLAPPDRRGQTAGLAGHRGAGKVRRLPTALLGPDAPELEIVPLARGRLSGLKSGLGSAPKFPEGGDDNLDRRGDWFRGRSGDR